MSGIDTRGIDVSALEQAPFPAVEQGLRIYFAEEAFDHATARGNATPDREIGGVLVGVARRDDAGPYVRIDAIIDALEAEEKSTELTFTHATWNRIHEEMDRNHEGKSILGWFHTHPGFGIFLSDRDEFIHRSFFNLPYQVALVYDPKSREHGVFAWHENSPTRCPRYWIGRSEQTWRPPMPDSDPTSSPNRKEAASPAAAPAASPSPPPRIDAYTLGTGALLVALLAGMIGWWVGTGTGRDAARDVEIRLARARAEGANDIARALNAELLPVLQRAIGDERARRPLLEAIAALGEALTKLDADPTDAEARRRANEAATTIARFEAERRRAADVLAALAAASRDEAMPTRELARALSRQQSALGEVCVELATNAVAAGDRERADRLLALAMSIDPNRSAFYARKREALAK